MDDRDRALIPVFKPSNISPDLFYIFYDPSMIVPHGSAMGNQASIDVVDPGFSSACPFFQIKDPQIQITQAVVD